MAKLQPDRGLRFSWLERRNRQAPALVLWCADSHLAFTKTRQGLGRLSQQRLTLAWAHFVETAIVEQVYFYSPGPGRFDLCTKLIAQQVSASNLVSHHRLEQSCLAAAALV